MPTLLNPASPVATALPIGVTEHDHLTPPGDDGIPPLDLPAPPSDDDGLAVDDTAASGGYMLSGHWTFAVAPYPDSEVPAEASAALDDRLATAADSAWWTGFSQELPHGLFWTPREDERDLARTVSAFEFGYDRAGGREYEAASYSAYREGR